MQDQMNGNTPEQKIEHDADFDREFVKDLLREEIAARKEEISLRKSEIEIRKKEIDTGADFARESLNAKVIDRQNEREERRKTLKVFAWSGIAILASVLLFLGLALLMNKDHVALEIVRGIFYALAGATGGGAGGYYLGAKQKPSKEERSPKSSDS